jgi:hypothetical protein
VWGGTGVRSVDWNGTHVAVTRGADGSLNGTVPGPQPVTLPALTNWRFTSEAAPAKPGFDDSSWTLADHPVSTYRSTAAATPCRTRYAAR